VNRLQDRAAELFGMEAGLYFPTGTQSNLAALMSHCGRGE
jgi:threonine aldolase